MWSTRPWLRTGERCLGLLHSVSCYSCFNLFNTVCPSCVILHLFVFHLFTLTPPPPTIGAFFFWRPLPFRRLILIFRPCFFLFSFLFCSAVSFSVSILRPRCREFKRQGSKKGVSRDHPPLSLFALGVPRAYCSKTRKWDVARFFAIAKSYVLRSETRITVAKS